MAAARQPGASWLVNGFEAGVGADFHGFGWGFSPSAAPELALPFGVPLVGFTRCRGAEFVPWA